MWKEQWVRILNCNSSPIVSFNGKGVKEDILITWVWSSYHIIKCIGLDFSGIKQGADGAMAFMAFALGTTLISGTIFIISLCQESAVLGTSAAHCMTFAGKSF